MFKKIYWWLLGFRFLSVGNVEFNKSRFYKQGYNEIKLYYGKQHRVEIWGKKNKRKPQVNEREWYQWLIGKLPDKHITQHCNFLGVFKEDCSIFVIKNRGAETNRSYNSIGDFYSANSKYFNEDNNYLVLVYRGLGQNCFYNMNRVQLVENDLILVIRKESLEVYKNEYKKYFNKELEVVI